MDFELKNLEMVENSSEPTSNRHEHLKSQSLILNELQKENEELQNKLKLNYRRLLLFEAENNKLIEEKNKYYFEAQNHIEKSKMLSEKNSELENENIEFDENIQLLNEKLYTLDKINKSQLTEIKRFSKFHVKIQNVVKPYILQIKTQLAQTQRELKSALSQLELFKNLNEDLHGKNIDLMEQAETQAKIQQVDKNSLVQSYEDQIHVFSKEILAQQNQNEALQKEILRLKKANEFKNYYENELIKFKRIHEEDQSKVQILLDQKNQLDTRLLGLEESLAQLKIETAQAKSRLEEKENTLEVTRKQLTKQIDESVTLHERLNRLEKLNNQLSREMS